MAWGAVPTAYTGVETAEELWAALAGLLKELESWGLSRRMLADQALITPACGLGTRGQDEARTIPAAHPAGERTGPVRIRLSGRGRPLPRNTDHR